MFQFLPLFGLLLFGATILPGAPPPDVNDEATVVAASLTQGPESVLAPLVESRVGVHSEAGLKVAVDPATGRIIAQPTEADLEVLAEGIRIQRRGSTWELESFNLAHGGEGVFLDGWADHSLVVRRDAEGRLRVGCSAGDDHGSTEGETGENLR